MLRPIFAALCVTTLLCASVFAADTATPSETPPAALATPIKSGLSIAHKEAGPSGLTGYLMKDQGGTYYTFWVTPDGKYMMAGALINEAGDNLTAQFQDKYEPHADLAALWPKLEKADQITTGSKSPKKVIYAFVDPNCPFCHLLWLAAKPYEDAGVQIRWIETGFLHEDSMGKAAAIVGATDRVAALNSSQENFQAGGLKPLPPASIPEASSMLLKDNLTLMHAFGFKGVPGIVYKDAKGVIHTKDGMPKLSELAGIADMAVLPETDPSLERFK